MISVRVNLTAREGKQLELGQAIDELRDKIAAEKGCIRCRVFETPMTKANSLCYRNGKTKSGLETT